MSKSLCVVAALLLASPMAGAEVFKCAREGGVSVYQNFPCNIDSIGSEATAAPPPDAPASQAAPAAQEKSKAPAMTVATVPKSLGPAQEPRIGMTFDEVRNSTWGPPQRVETSEVMEGVIDIWYYGGDRSVQFTRKGRVFNIEQ